MRHSLFLFLLPFSLVLPILPTSVAKSSELLSQINSSSQDFWSQAQRLVEEQLYLIDQIQQALASPDLNQVEAIRAQLILQSGTVERFLKSQYRNPRLLCSNGTSPSARVPGLSESQKQVYCALYTSTQQLNPMISQLERRLPRVGGLAAPNTLPRLNEPSLNPPFNVQSPVTPRFPPVPDFPDPEPPVFGVPMKTPFAEDDPPIQPAILPPQPVINPLIATRAQLLAALPAFPASVRILDPAQTPQISDRTTYGLSPVEPQVSAKLLDQPTGIASILPREIYRPEPNPLRNPLQPTVAEQLPFVPLGKSLSGLTSRFAIQIADDNFQIPLPGLNYGFMVNLGAISLADIDPTLQNIPTLSQQQQELFLNYLPPDRVNDLQTDQRRFLTGKAGFDLAPSISVPASTQAPIVLNNTYLLRLFQFQLPEVVLKRGVIFRKQRRYLNRILETPSSDVLVAFQPISRRDDGSYTVLWRVLNQFPDPKITDLQDYVDFE